VAGKRQQPRGELTLRAQVDLGLVFRQVDTRAPDEFRISVRRPDDLLVFELVFGNLQLAGETPERLVPKDPQAAAYFVVEFPPQSFGEEAFLDDAGLKDPIPSEASGLPNYPPKNHPAFADVLHAQLPISRIRMAGRSRVAFDMPAGVDGLPYTLLDVLAAIRTWPMRLDINAAPDPDVTVDRAWLESVTAADGWAAATALLSEGLDAGVRRPIAQAGRRVARLAAADLAKGRRRGLDRRLRTAMESELGRLAERHLQLRGSQGRELGFAALALHSVRALARSRETFELDASIIGHLGGFLVPFAPHEPAQSITGLELPYRIVLSPIESARWRHSDQPVEATGRTELWHTRLTTTEGLIGPDDPSKVRAIWSPDYAIDPQTIVDRLLKPPPSWPRPFRMSVDALDRRMLVQVMSGFDEADYTPRSSIANRLVLSALGGLLDAEGTWDVPPPHDVGLQQWRHVATLGRDQYVRVVYAGFLCPFGHPASLIKVTERKFASLGDDPTGERVAVLRQRFFIVVRVPVKTYDGANHEFNGNNFPFTSVEILSRVTPNLAEPADCLLTNPGDPIYKVVPPRDLFWPTALQGDLFAFDIAATDLTGNRVSFAMPLLFVGTTANSHSDQLTKQVLAAYNDDQTADRRAGDLGGATVCYAPPLTGEPDPKGDPRLPTATATFHAGNVVSTSEREANFYPEVENAEVGIRAVQRLLGKRDAIVPMQYAEVYRDNAYDPAQNPGEVFLRTPDGKDYSLEFGGGASQAKSDALGALATPAMAIQCLSRIMGPAADRKNVTTNTFNPTSFFQDAKILGGIDLAKILGTVTDLAGDNVPKMLSRELPAGGGQPQRVEASFDWRTEVTTSGDALFIPRADPAGTTTLVMSGRVTTPVADPSRATYEATATIDNFKLNLFGFIVLWFDLLRFDSKRGQKPDVAVNLHPGEEAVVFGGPLEFVNDLRHLIPVGGFSDPPGINVTPSGIDAGYSLNLPAIPLGVFALSNASLGAGFALPFDSQPVTVRFNFSEREHPFSLTVSLLGGGGFFAIGIGSHGVKEIEAALEFGAAVQIDLGVASGGVEIKAGIYFHWLEPQTGKGSVELAGYVRLHGELSVLGIISASLTFNLQIAYLKQTPNSIVWGEATLVVEIEILFFSTSVSVRCRREFGGGEDPTFVQLVPSQAVWDEYCIAFAEEAA
jgi:hypothetical protein